MTSKQLRQKYLDFFKDKGHAIISSASLIPDNDPTVLFTAAGMHPLVPYLMGQKHPAGARLADCQKCVRTNDIDEVGDATHHTFFEMLGNWSLGDYFKKEAIKMSWEFLTSPAWLNLDKNRLAVSVFAGDEDAPFDQEAYDIWLELGMSQARIARLPKKNNWWGPAGLTGPCGPDTEMFYWVGDPKKTPNSFNDDNLLWLEVWNDVFMQYNKTAADSYELLRQKNVDTGMGLERILAAMNGFDDNYKTDLFKNLIFKIENLSSKKYGASLEITKAMRIVADHLKAATFIMGDDKGGVAPSNVNQGYVVRRLIRRAIRYGRQLEITQESWTKEIAKVVAHDYREIYPELVRNIDKVIELLKEEEAKFGKTLEQGLKELKKMKPKFISAVGVGSLSVKSGVIDYGLSGDDLFNLYATYGFPIELSLEEIKKIYRDFNAENNIKIPIVELEKDDEERLLRQFNKQFHEASQKHQELSRTASAGMFKGGLADASMATIKYHTAAHILLAALRKILGEHVIQKGSNITAERLRFDFAHKEKMTDQEKRQVENLVNQAIKQNLVITCEEMALEDAKAKGAQGIFETKYGERVKVYTIGDEKLYFSKEICGGPHIEKTGILGYFKIQKEESSSADVRRIKAILQ